MVNARRYNFSPDAAPYVPSPVLQSLDGLSGSDSTHSTPKQVQGSPCLSTPGCNPSAKPFLPASQGLMLPGRVDDKGGMPIHQMLNLRTSPSEVHFPVDVPSEVLSSCSSSWLSDACRPLTKYSSESEEASSEPGTEPLPPPPRTSLSFMKAMNKDRKMRKQHAAAETLSPSVCA